MKKVKLKNCGDYVVSPKISTNELSQDNYITTDNMLPNKAGITKAENVPLNLKVTQFLENDILLSNIRPYFKKIWLAEFMGGCSADVLVFRTNENYDSTYIKYCLSQDSFFAYDMAGSKGSKMPRGDKNHILNFELLDLDITNQRKIGHLLKSIDDKIAINNQINELLERTAKAIYEYYFVQFDFPNKQGKPYKSSGGTMRFDSTLNRLIPKDFEVISLKDICDIESGYPFSTDDYTNNGKYKIITIKNVLNNYISSDTDNTIDFIPKNMPNYCSLKIGDILLSLTGNVGRVRIVFENNLLLNQRVALLNLKNQSYRSFVYLIFLQQHFKQILENIATGSNQKNLSPIETEKLPILFSQEIIKKFESITKPLLNKIINNHIENQKLKNLRDFLLPLLINAQVQI